jgi:membrane associated rhomboid family serine protease
MPSYSTSTVSFGPGPVTPAVKAIIIANVVTYLVTFALPGPVIGLLGLSPAAVVEGGRIWQLATYLFVHSPSSFMHILFNMLAIWMFGVELERRWGTVGFAKFYFVAGVGAGLSVLLAGLAPFEWARPTYEGVTIGASGAVYGILMAWALLFPHREILFMFIFPLRARMFVFIVGAIAFLSAVGASGSGVSNLAHLGGLLAAWLYLKGPGSLRPELGYWLTRWRMERMRRKLNLHRGGRDDDWQRRIH